jgi:glycine hydroxymethyltransferase
MNSTFLSPLSKVDPELAQSIVDEGHREETGLELIASENYVSKAVLEAQGSTLTNKYAEGYPGKRYYGGCLYVDRAEALAIERVTKLFECEAANVQPHSGSNANLAVFMTLLKPGETFLGMDLSQGGHLTHGSPVNFSGKLYRAVHYGLHPTTHRIDFDQVRDLAKKEKPKMLLAGASAYSRIIDFKTFSEIAQEVGAELFVDMAHIAGLVAAKLHPSPITYAAYTTTTTHKTLRGPRGGLILSSAERLKAMNSAIFPGIQGGPLMHVIAAKAVAFGEALRPEFLTYQKQILENAKRLSEVLMQHGFNLVTGGTDNHLMLVDLSQSAFGEVTGKDAEAWLDQAGITVNKNTVPGEKRSPFITSGIRIGTPAITTRGVGLAEMDQLGLWIRDAISSRGDIEKLSRIRNEVTELCKRFPLYG